MSGKASAAFIISKIFIIYGLKVVPKATRIEALNYPRNSSYSAGS